MFLCFVDESGSPESPNPDEVYVVAGVAIPVTAWGALLRLA